MNREFGEFNGGAFALGVLGYDFAGSLGAKEALLAGNYVYQSPDENNTFTRSLEHIVSVNFKFERGAWGVRTDISAATGYLGQSDLWGVMAMPFVNITDKLQFLGRYTFLDSEDQNGVRFATYESRWSRTTVAIDTTSSILAPTTSSTATSSNCRAACSLRTWPIAPATAGSIQVCRGRRACASVGDHPSEGADHCMTPRKISTSSNTRMSTMVSSRN